MRQKDIWGFPSVKCKFSTCKKYRYTFTYRWADGGTLAMFIGLNPSTADENQDDPTIRRCIRFAKDWGHSGFVMTNLFAFRATDPDVMKAHPSPVGEMNDSYLVKQASMAAIVIAAWGVHGVHLGRASQVAAMIPNLHCLGLSKEGHPRHPLYMPANSTPIPYMP